jgi:hypothetical protein
VHVKEGSDVILGATIVAPGAGDMVCERYKNVTQIKRYRPLLSIAFDIHNLICTVQQRSPYVMLHEFIAVAGRPRCTHARIVRFNMSYGLINVQPVLILLLLLHAQISEISVAMQHKIGLGSIAGVIHPYPTKVYVTLFYT